MGGIAAQALENIDHPRVVQLVEARLHLRKRDILTADPHRRQRGVLRTGIRSKPSRVGGLDFFTWYGTIVLRDAAQTAGGRPHHPKGGETMRITLHIGSFTVTIIVKSRNRHSAK